MSLLAQKVQADLNAAGMRITLNGLPRTTALQLYRDGKNQLGVWSWAADYPDGNDFLVYGPGRTVGKRAGWLPENEHDRLARGDGPSQVAAEEIPDVDRVLFGERPVEPPLPAESGHGGRVGGGLLAEVGGDRVRRHRVGQHEAQEGDAEQHRPEQQKPPGHVEPQSAQGPCTDASGPGPSRPRLLVDLNSGRGGRDVPLRDPPDLSTWSRSRNRRPRRC